MASIIIKTHTRPTFQQVTKKFRAAHKKLRDQQRDSMRELGRLLIIHLKSEAPKKTGRFAERHTYRTYQKGDTIELRTYAPQPLAKWIRFGTRPHIIAARNARFLRFYWERGPHGPGIYFYRFVRHPGTKPNPYAERAIKAWKPSAIVELKKMGRAFLIELTKG